MIFNFCASVIINVLGEFSRLGAADNIDGVAIELCVPPSITQKAMAIVRKSLDLLFMFISVGSVTGEELTSLPLPKRAEIFSPSGQSPHPLRQIEPYVHLAVALNRGVLAIT